MGNDRLFRVALAATVVAGLGCGLAQPASAQSLTDRFKGLFGGKSDEPAPAPGAAPKAEQDIGDLTCPDVRVRAGASTYAVAAPGKQPVGNDLRFQATIGKTARECSLNGGVITARIGIQGRVIAGPAGAPSSVQVPLRVAVVQGGISEKTIATKAYQTTVNMTETGSEPFTLVVEDLVYPVPAPGTSDNYIFYIGFDPQALKPERPAPRKKAAPTQ
ncbi:hypothetical protein [Bradyrhizobium sp. AUGA SZCCT0431]|uniref:hypothetical protein n=1 Tax=Bradyrhizobium sp. AUGA SZCCT0431 TaxID=2807674 RepID=UPI001BA5C948|nr:hypothetical protein [Bradyrhizobium sp. AUGA SZCCT0431]MBR1148308.1 hypothetical protein [Bradyrhizobium sp. AUGA SZCCT0431]